MERKQIAVHYIFTVCLHIRCLWRYNKEKNENKNFEVCTVCLKVEIRLDQK